MSSFQQFADERSIKQSWADSWWLGPLKGDSEPSFTKPLTTVQVIVAQSLVTSSKPKVEWESYTDICVVGDDCLDIHDYNRPIDVYSARIPMS